jgi:hypothetical protein
MHAPGPNPDPSPPAKRGTRGRAWKILGAVAAVLLIASVAGRVWLVAYLHGPEFRRLLNARLGEALDSDIAISALQFDGLSLYVENVRAQGYDGSHFAGADLTQIRARFSLRNVFKGAWVIESIDAQHLAVHLDGTRISRPPAVPDPQTQRKIPPSAATSGSGTRWSFIPQRIEIARATIREFDLTWGDLPSTQGSLRGVQVSIEPSENGWAITGDGGSLASSALPPLDVRQLRLRHRGDSLFINEAILTAADGGRASVTGEVDFIEKLTLDVRIDRIDPAPFLSDDWRVRLRGKISGDVRVHSPLPARGAPSLSGKIELTDGHLEALPVLNEIAAFTRTQQFRKVPLTHASAEFEQKTDRLTVRELAIESEGLLRVEGGVTMVQRQLDGSFMVGVPPSTLRWIPGAQEKVFSTTRDGYAWASMRVSGPADSPGEDLSGRLATAAAETVVEKVESTARDAIQIGRDAAKSALDILIPRDR